MCRVGQKEKSSTLFLYCDGAAVMSQTIDDVIKQH